MSQRGPGHPPASRRSSRSPIRSEQVSPTQYAPQPPSSSDVRYEATPGTSVDSRPGRQPPPRPLGVHNILNPSEPRSMAPGPLGRPTAQPREAEGRVPTPSTSYSAPRAYYHGHAATGSLPATPVATVGPPLNRGPISGRNSPTTAYPPFPALNNPRKILSPKAPRSMSLGQALPPRDVDPRHSLMPVAAPTKRPYESDTADEPRPAPGLHHPPGLSSSVHNPILTPPRSLSQPMGRQIDASHGPLGGVPPGEAQHRAQGTHATGQFPHGMPAIPPSRPMSRMDAPVEGASAWPEMLRRQGGTFVGMEAQQAYMTLPGSDTPIPVQVDYSQASKKADEKRQRNAKASTRHRRKKKNLQEENLKQLSDLKDERQLMVQRQEELEAQRDFYRDDRNRLRDLVARTPAISKHAAGPPSPVLLKPILFADDSPVMPHAHAPTPNQGYVSESSSVDRPVQRRRTDDHPDFSTPMYGPPSSGPLHGLPSMHGQTYGIPPPRPPSAASSGSGERLPPLRAMEGPPPPTAGLGHSHPQEQDLRTGQWRAAQPPHYETGWANAPRKSQEGHPW